MLNIFTKYISVGVVNTFIHWVIFAVVYSFTDEQSVSNLSGFCVAVTFSFFANACWTFAANITVVRYIAFVLFMGLLSWLVGMGADISQLPPLITLISFSTISLTVGFVYSNYFVFGDRE